MVLLKAALTGFVGISLCMADISGVVTDTSGVTPVVGAVVQLEKGGPTATTGANGRFTLAVTPVGIIPGNGNFLPHGLSAEISGAMLRVTLEEKSAIEVSMFDLCGKSLFSLRTSLNAGIHSLSLPYQGAGIYLYSVKAGNRELVLKGNSVNGRLSPSAVSPQGQSSDFLMNQAKAATINEVITVTKAGLLNYRCGIGNPDTSGLVIKMIANAGNVTDFNGNEYQTVKIGTQTWTVENWRCTKYADGTPIPLDTSTTTWFFAETPKFCYYANTTNAAFIKKYGALYNWFVVNPANSKKIAPTGWHVPTRAEWETLQSFLIAKGYNWDGTTTGGNKIAKSVAARTDWRTNSIPGTTGCNLAKNNSSGLSGFPGGFRANDGTFDYQSIFCQWWSATEEFAIDAHYFYMHCDDLTFRRDFGNKSCGLSVRLIKN